MKTIFCVLIVAFLSIYYCIGTKVVSRSAPNNNPNYRVDYLFEHDGCKVYRFYDMGNYIYFTNCNGEAIRMIGDSTRVINRTNILD